MNYKKILDQLVYKRKVLEPLTKCGDGTIETHHILPRSLGGSNDKSNLVNLTLREHYFIHELTVKIYIGTKYEATAIRAWNNMCIKISPKVKNSRLYRYFRLKYNQRAGDSVRGKIFITDGITTKAIYPDDGIPSGWRRGFTRTEEGLRNIGRASKLRVGEVLVTDGTTNLRVRPDDIPDGFKLGVSKSWGHNKNRIAVTDGIHQKLVDPENIPEGYYPGYKPLTVEHLEKIRSIHRNMTEETKKRRSEAISKALTGKPSWRKGKHLTKDHARKISESNRGQKRSKEVRDAISLRQKGKIKVNNWIRTIYADPNNIPEGFVKGQLHKKK